MDLQENKAWACRHNNHVTVWSHDDKPQVFFVSDREGKRFFILRGMGGSIAHEYSDDITDIEQKIGHQLKDKEILEINWE